MEEVIQSIAVVGGFGYLSYWIGTRTDNMDWGSKNDRKLLIIFLSSLNYLIYILVHQCIQDIGLSLVLTILINLSMSLFLSDIFRLLAKVTNLFREDKSLPKQTNTFVWDDIFNSSATHCFIFDFKGNVIASGALHLQSGLNEEKSLDLWPHFDIDDLYWVEDEDELYSILDNNKRLPRVYLNFEKKIKIIYF